MRMCITKALCNATVVVASFGIALVGSVGHAWESDPLPSWTDGPTKSAIIQFVQDVTGQGGSKYVVPQQRIATFDNDGTLWCEQPVVQIAFTMHRIKAMAADHPEWKDQQPYKSVLAGDQQYLMDDYLNGGHEFLKVIETAHAGIPIEEFGRHVRDFLVAAEHPRFKVPFTVNHDDEEREYAYAEKDNASLDAAKEQGWHVVSMKSDWETVFSSGNRN